MSTVPAELIEAMQNALAERDNDLDAAGADELLRAAERLLRRVLERDCTKREAALDLLTVDALVTYALERAAADPLLLDNFPDLAMRRIAATLDAHK